MRRVRARCAPYGAARTRFLSLLSRDGGEAGVSAVAQPMNLREKFLLDLRGYLVIHGFLTAEEVFALNAAVDVSSCQSACLPCAPVRHHSRIADTRVGGRERGLLGYRLIGEYVGPLSRGGLGRVHQLRWWYAGRGRQQQR